MGQQLKALDGWLTVGPGSFMEREVYVRPEIFELEMSELLPRTWMFVCDIGEVARPGDFVTTTIGYEPVIILRGADRRLRAFSNVCTHRACTVLTDAGNCGQKMVCPYHGWSYGLDGHLLGLSYKSGFACGPEMDKLGLHELAVDVWERFVFVNVSGEAPPLMEYLEEAPELLSGHTIADTKVVHAVDDDVAANWKILVDNAFCDYHVPFVHRRLMRSHRGISDFTESAGNYTNVLRSQLKPSATTQWARWPTLRSEEVNQTCAIGIYPNLVVIGFVTGDVHLLYWLPVELGRSRALVKAYSHVVTDDGDFRFGPDGIERLQHEDYDICERVQQGMRSKYFHPGPRHYLETRVILFRKSTSARCVNFSTTMSPRLSLSELV